MAQPSFKFIGEISLPKAESKQPFLKMFKKDGVDMASMNFGIKESKNNMGFIECFGSIPKNGVILTKDKNNKDIKINWKDRFSEKVINSVAYYRKLIVDLGEELGGRKEFITAYDAIAFLKETLPNYNGKVCATGQMQKRFYKDKYYDKFLLNNIYAVDSETKNKLLVTADIYYKKDCIDKSEWKDNKVIAIDGYIPMYIDKEQGLKYMPQRFVFNASKINPNDERHMKLLNYKLKYVESKNRKWEHLLWETKLINGAEEIEFDESQLTDAQKEQIELGIKELNDFRPNGSIVGERITEYRLLEPVLKEIGNENFSEGFIECDCSNEEFEDKIFVPNETEKLSDIINTSSKEKENEEDENEEVEIIDDIDDDDLFS